MENKTINEMINTRPLNKEELEAFGKDMDTLLKKHDCEIGVTSTITIMKRIEKAKEEGIKSPFMIPTDNGANPSKN